MTKWLVMGTLCGVAWGVVAVAVFAGMFRGLLPAPGATEIPLAITLVVAYFPFLVGAGLETLIGRHSPSFAEVSFVTIACGLVLGVALSSVIGLGVRRRKQT